MANMNTDANAMQYADLDEELVAVLIAISVISKHLAKKITAKNMTTEEKRDVHVLPTGRKDCRHEAKERQF
jgi:hypothetical protein